MLSTTIDFANTHPVDILTMLYNEARIMRG